VRKNAVAGDAFVYPKIRLAETLTVETGLFETSTAKRDAISMRTSFVRVSWQRSEFLFASETCLNVGETLHAESQREQERVRLRTVVTMTAVGTPRNHSAVKSRI
jgi:hypothetical protein